MTAILFAADWSRGVELETETDKSAAVHFYGEWLKENREDSDYSVVLTRYLSLLPDKDAFYREAQRDWNLPAEEEARVLNWLARVYELNGEIEKAADSFGRAYEAYPVTENIQNLLHASEMNIRMGRYEEGDRILTFLQEQKLQADLKEAVSVLFSRSRFQQGEKQEALLLIKPYIDNSERSSLSLLLWTRELYMDLGLTLEREMLEERISLRFTRMPGSGFDSEWRLKSLPETVFGQFQEQEAVSSVEEKPLETLNLSEVPVEVTEKDDTEVPGNLTARIQTGSYQDRDNAEEQIKDLKKAGFSCGIEEVSLNNTVYHRVMVIDIPVDELEYMSLRLKEAGFEGFPVY